MSDNFMIGEIINRYRKNLIDKQRQQRQEVCISGIGTLPVRKTIDKVIHGRQRINWTKYLPPEIIQLTPPLTYSETHGEGYTGFIMGEDCERYVFGKNGIMNKLPGNYPIIDDPREGDIVLYYEKTKFGNDPRHVGKFQEDGSVISRWGDGGPVFKHPVHFVPTEYGDIVYFVRISEEQIRDFKKLPDPDWC